MRCWWYTLIGKKKSSYVHIKVMRKSLTTVPLFFHPDSFSSSPSENQHILPLDILYVLLSDGRIKRNPLHALWPSLVSGAKMDQRVLVFDVTAAVPECLSCAPDLFSACESLAPRLKIFSHSSTFPIVFDTRSGGDETTSADELINNSRAFSAHLL